MHELKRTIHRIGFSRSSRPTGYLLCRSSYYSTSTCVHRHQQKPSVEQSIPLMHSDKTIGNAPIKLLSQNSPHRRCEFSECGKTLQAPLSGSQCLQGLPATYYADQATTVRRHVFTGISRSLQWSNLSRSCIPIKLSEMRR